MLTNDLRVALADDAPIEQTAYENEEMTDGDFRRVAFDRVRFTRCRFSGGRFAKCSFYDVTFVDCDLSNCGFEDTFFKGGEILRCGAIGADFCRTRVKGVALTDTGFRYANFTQAVWEDVTAKGCRFTEAILSDMKLRRVTFQDADMTQADFFRTPLRGVDLSSCVIRGITVSDSRFELSGMKIGVAQAPDIALMLGVEIV